LNVCRQGAERLGIHLCEHFDGSIHGGLEGREPTRRVESNILGKPMRDRELERLVKLNASSGKERSHLRATDASAGIVHSSDTDRFGNKEVANQGVGLLVEVRQELRSVLVRGVRNPDLELAKGRLRRGSREWNDGCGVWCMKVRRGRRKVRRKCPKVGKSSVQLDHQPPKRVQGVTHS